MTLVLTVNGPETIWMLVDRRLSYPNSAPKDDAIKVMCLETTDGVALLGYAGLGSTVKGTEPSEWMSSVLRGRNLPLEKSLLVLTKAFVQQFPPHLVKLSGSNSPAHITLIPAFLQDELCFYTIGMAFSPDRSAYTYSITRHYMKEKNLLTNRVPRFLLSGSGAGILLQSTDWKRELLHLVNACDKHKIRHERVADYLATLNYKVYQCAPNGTVGPRCIVVWRNKKPSTHKSGGGHCCYTGATPDVYWPALPTIGTGLDMRAIAETMMSLIPRDLQPDTAPWIDMNRLGAEVALLPSTPDEELN